MVHHVGLRQVSFTFKVSRSRSIDSGYPRASQCKQAGPGRTLAQCHSVHLARR